MIRLLLALLFLAIYMPIAALISFPWALITGDGSLIYRLGILGCKLGVRIAGIKVKTVGLDTLDSSKTYIFMSNHASNVDPPVLLSVVPRRSSVLVKQELFRIPILGRAMRLTLLVPVDRRNREAAIASLRAAADVLHRGINLTIFPEGTRSRDGRLLPFKKGPFHIARDTGIPVVPVTLVGTHEMMPKGSNKLKPGTITAIFHPPIFPADFSKREALLQAVRSAIESGLEHQSKNTGLKPEA
jgi:1-acyl-sn-glycerol-3-phosphate acyltransferase